MMQLIDRWTYTLTMLIPSDMRRRVELKGVYAGKENEWHRIVGLSATVGLVVGALLFTASFMTVFELTQLYKLLLRLNVVIGPLLGYFFGYIILYFKADKRTSSVEDVLPDTLQLIAANLRAGNTPYDAVKAAAIDEFGALGQELRRVTTMAAGNISFGDVLMEVSDRIESSALDRSIKLFASSLKSGGHLAELLEGLAVDITERRALKKELITNTRTNTMFIMFTIVVGTPMLLAISVYFVEVVSNLQASTGGAGDTSGFGLGGLGGEISISATFLVQFSYIILFVTGLLASLFIGSMIHGDPKKGLKLAPLVIAGSYVGFIIARYAITYFLGNPIA